MSQALRVMIVDDEPLARENLRRLLAREGGVDVVGEAADAEAATALIRSTRPDLVLLDVRIRDGNGFEVLDRIEPDARPPVVFVSAHDEHAVRAFSVRAIDYLLKPIEAHRLHAAIDRARDHVAMKRRLVEQERDSEPGAEGAASAPLARFVVRSVGKILLVDVADIDWIEAAGNYVRLHLGEESHLFRETMNNMEGRLDGRRFVRIHRSRIVNTDRIKEMQPWFNGEYVVVLQNGTRLTLSRGYREKLQERLGKGF